MRPTRILLAMLAALAAVAGRAGAATVGAEATSTVWGTNANDFEYGNGLLPVSASASYTRPNPPGDGAISASASAEVGRLGGRASVSVANAPGYLAPTFSLYGTSTAQGYAYFFDSWTFTDRPLDTPGTLRLSLAFDGAGSGSATNATPIGDGRFIADLTSVTPGGNGHDYAEYNSGFLAVAAEQASLELDFFYGRAIQVRGFLVARAWVVSLQDATSYSGSSAAVFDQTAELTALEVKNAQGQWTTSHTLVTESGGVYPFQAPEPAPLASALVTLAALALRRVTSRESAARRSAPR